MRNLKKPFLLFIQILLIALAAGAAGASEITVIATVDKNEATLDDYIILKISVQGTREEPALPALPDFRIQSRGSSSQFRIINGQMSSAVEYNYILYPQKAGTFTIGPFAVKHKGSKVKSKPITVKISKTTPQAKQSEDIFVVAEVDNENPYHYEEIIYRFKFYRRVKVANARLTESPAFEGFLTEDLGKEKEYQKVINGQTYLVTELRQALFPTKTGVLKIEPSTLQCDVVVKKRGRRRGFFDDPFFDDSFFGFSETVPKILRTSPITVMVKTLPTAGKPAGFKNLVGEFSLNGKLSTRKLEVGESVTLTLTLAGIGNLKNQQTLDIQGLQNFKVYDDKPVFETQLKGGKVGGKLVLKKALVPLTEGQLQIPPVTVSYFNPSSGSYTSLKAGPYLLDVVPSSDDEKFQVVESVKKSGIKQEVKILGHDILPVHTSLEALSARRLRPLSLTAALFFLLPVIGFVCTFSIKRSRERLEQDRGLIRFKQAHKRFSKALPLIKSALTQDDPLFYQRASKALKDFIGDKLNIAGSALTPKELERRLPEYNVPAETVKAVTDILEFFDSGQFGFTKHSVEEREAVFKSMKKMINSLNRKIKRK